MSETITRKVPAEALEFRLPCEFVADEKPDPMRGPVRLTARSSEPIEHWYWGRLVHDMAGMQHKPRIALDWLHDQNMPLGFADSFDVSNGDLRIEGQLIATEPDDQAAKVLAKGRAGIPFEASIKFDFQNLKLEEIPEGYLTEVNGRTLEGPLTVARQWNLRGVAVCLYGYDPRTETSFSADSGREFNLSIPLNKEQPVSKKQESDAALNSDQQAAEEPQVDPKAEFKALLADYTARFGPTQAVQWAMDDKPLVDCYAEFVAQLREQHAAELADVSGKLTEANIKIATQQAKLDALAAANLGEQTPLSSTPAGPNDQVDAKAAELAKKMPEGLAKFAAGMKLPKGEPAKQTD